MYEKAHLYVMIGIPISIEIIVPPLFHLTPCIAIRSNLYFANSFPTDLWRLLMSYIPNLISIFRFLCPSKESVQVQGLL
jgi:hypothetical protein